jgi:hypothetical protein
LLLAPYQTETARGCDRFSCDRFSGFYLVLIFALTAHIASNALAALAIRLFFFTVAFLVWIWLRRKHPPPMWLKIEVVMVEDVVMLPHCHCASDGMRCGGCTYGQAMYAPTRTTYTYKYFVPDADEGAQSHAQPPADGWREEVFCV